MLAWGVAITVHFTGRAIAAVRAVAATEILPRDLFAAWRTWVRANLA